MKLSFSAGVVCGDMLYFSDNSCNALMKLNLNNGKLIYLDSFPNEEGHFFIHKQCLKDKSKLYFIPNSGHNIHIYDLESEKLTYVEINRNSETRLLFNGGILIDEELWIIPCDISQNILSLNTITLEIKTLSSLEKVLKQDVCNAQQSFWKFCLKEHDIYMALLQTNKIAKYNLVNGKVDIFETEIENIDSIYEADDVFWVCTSNGDVYSWDEKYNNSKKATLVRDDDDCGSYIVAESSNGEIYLIPNYGKQILKKVETGMEFKSDSKFHIDSPEVSIKRVNFETYDVWGGKIVLFPGFGDDLFIIGKNGTERLKAELNDRTEVYSEKRIDAIKREMYHDILYEGTDGSLKDYIKAVLK